MHINYRRVNVNNVNTVVLRKEAAAYFAALSILLEFYFIS